MPVRCRKLLHQGVDGDDAHAVVSTQRRPLLRIAEQQARQGHGQHLVGDAVHLPQRVNDRRPHTDKESTNSLSVAIFPQCMHIRQQPRGKDLFTVTGAAPEAQSFYHFTRGEGELNSQQSR